VASLCPKCLGQLQPGSALCPDCGAEQGATRATGVGAGQLPASNDPTASDPTAAPGAGAPLLHPAVVPPPPGAGGINPAFQVTPPRSEEHPAVPPLRQPPGPAPFGSTGAIAQTDAGSPASLLGPSSHAAPPDTHMGAPPAHYPPPASGPPEAPEAPPPPQPSEAPADAGIPSAHELMFGPAPPANQPPGNQPPAIQPPPTQAFGIPPLGTQPPSPTPPGPIPGGLPPAISPFQGHPTAQGQAQGQAQALHSAPVALVSGDARRKRVIAKLSRRSTLLPAAAVIVVIAVMVSLFAISVPSNSALNSPGAHGSDKSGGALARRANTVSVPLLSPSDDPRPDISIKIGNDPHPLHVVLDTGSVGLRVFSNLVPTGQGKGINVTGVKDSIEYVDGTQFAGPVADALIHIGKLTTTRTVPFELVQSVTCDPQIPYCPASGGAAQFEADDVDGVMGIGLGGVYQGDPTTNPLLSLAAPYRDSWSIAMSGNGANLPAPGTLVLGAPDPDYPQANFSLQQQGAPVDGSPSWNDQFNLCWAVGGLSNCDLTVFDSGSDLTVLSGNGFQSVPTDQPGTVSTLTTGTQVECSQEVDGQSLWSFNAGSGTMQTVYVVPGGSDSVNSGVQAFYSFTVTYDEVHGEIFLA
jgi:hypothetical protein